MQSAQSKGSGSRPEGPKVAARRPPVRRGLLPITIAIGVLIAAASLGVMFVVLSGLWPSGSVGGADRAPGSATPQAIREAGLSVEKAGEPREDGDQIIFPVKVTNNLNISLAPRGTPTPNAPTAVPGPVKLNYAGIIVRFYKNENGNKRFVGVAIGNATNLAQGQSQTVDVVGTGTKRADFDEWEVEVDNIDAQENSGYPAPFGVTPPRAH